MSATAVSLLAPLGIAERAFAGLPRSPRCLPAAVHLHTRRYGLSVDSNPNPPVQLELHCREDGQWFWEYAENRFGQLQCTGVFDGYALWPQPPKLHDTAIAAMQALLADVRAGFPCKAATLVEQPVRAPNR